MSPRSEVQCPPRKIQGLTERIFSGVVCLALLSGCDLAERATIILEQDKSTQPKEVAPAGSLQKSAPSVSSQGQSARPPASPHAATPSAMIAPVDPVMPPSGTTMSFADLANRVDPAVVYVRTIQSARQGYRRVLRDGSGSGFVFDPAGKILTNHHVVAGAHAIAVEFKDGRSLIAQVVGADPLTDLAVLQVPAENLPALPFGDSDRIRVGDWVIAIGNPFGLEHTVSAGIISAKERTSRDVNLGDPDAYYSFLQTDASINPGNSGGPLVDLSGRVVGINTAINQGANNIGFAIPVNMIAELLPQLLQAGKVERAAIGVRVDDVSAEDVQRFGLADRTGALVVDVLPRGPAALAGVQPGDVVVSLNGHPVNSPEQLRFRASLCPVGQDVELLVLRAGKNTKLSVRPVPLALR